MNKHEVDRMIPQAYEVLSQVRIAENGKVNKAWRGQISSFGASIMQGSLLSAVSFFSAQGGAETKRERLMMAIWLLLNREKQFNISFEPKNDEEKEKYKEVATRLYKQVQPQPNDKKLKEDIVNAAVALKLAMNLYDMGKGTNDVDES